MEASAGQVIENEIRVRSVCVRIAAAFILVGPLELSGRQGTRGYLAVSVVFRGNLCFTEVIPQQQSNTRPLTITDNTVMKEEKGKNSHLVNSGYFRHKPEMYL